MTTDPLIVTHTVRVPVAAVESALAALMPKPGIEEVHAEPDGRRVMVTYDLDRVRFDEIERALTPAGAKPSGGPVNFLRRRWVRFTENNLLSSAHAATHTWYESPPEDGRPHRPPERRHLDRPQGA